MILPALVLTLAPLSQADALLLEGGTVHTMLPGEAPFVGSVWLEAGRVRAVVAQGELLEVPEGVRRVDVRDRHLVPSLIDGYVNFDPEHDLHYTVAGVGLVRDVGGDYVRALAERVEERRARALGPALLTAGALLDGDPPLSSSAVVLRDAAAVEGLLPILTEAGVDFLSTYLRLTPEARRKVLELGHAAGLEVWGPRPLDLDVAQAVEEGLDGLHFLDALLPQGVSWQVVQPGAFRGATQRLAESGTPLVPLYHASARRLENQLARPETRALLSLLSPTYVFWWRSELAAREASMTAEALEGGQRVLEKQADLVRALFEAGVPLLPGSGAPQPWLFPGRALHQELALWSMAGIPAADLVHLATRGAAELLGVAGEHGSIEPGAVANLLVLEADPTEDVRALGTIERLVLRGRLLEAEDLEDLLDTVAVREAKAHEALEREIVLEPLPLAEEAVAILDGEVETRSVGMRLSVERYRVAQLPGDRLLFQGHMVYPHVEGTPRREVITEQVAKDGLLEGVKVVQRQGDQVVTLEGLWTAGSWRMQQTVGEESLGVKTTPNRPVLVDTGSVTGLLVLAMAPLSERFPAIRLHQALEPEEAFWSVELDDEGAHQVRTHVGRLAFRLDEKGAIDRALVVAGAGVVETDGQRTESFGGPGLVLPLEKRREIRRRKEAFLARQAELEAESESGSGDEPEAAAEGDGGG